VLEQLYDENSGYLECEADEDTRVGSRFLDYQEKVKLSAGGEDGGRRYKDQLDKIHCRGFDLVWMEKHSCTHAIVDRYIRLKK
jgi:hypothetical protein